MEKQHIIDLLLENTGIESRYVGGGEEPTIIVFKDSEWWGLDDRQRFFESMLAPAFGSPAPTDWGKELSKIQDLREKAKQYIISVVPADGLFIGGFYVYEAGNGDVEVRHIEIRKSDNHITLNDADVRPIYSGDVSDSDWVQLALIVQKAITGGMGK